MNCRILEGKTFELPAVAGILSNNFVEARLHTDGDADARRERNRKLQKRFASSIANPWLVLVDPRDERKLAERGFLHEEELIEFLRSVL